MATEHKDIDRSAPAVVELDIVIDAPLENVWKLHTDIDRWPDWHPDVTRASLRGDLEGGTTFDWETAGLIRRG